MTSIRVSEETRRELAKIVGRSMAETGEAMSMDEAIRLVLDRNSSQGPEQSG